MGFDRIVDFIISLIEDFLPCFIVKQYQTAVVLRNGRIHRIRSGAFCWKIPFLDDPHVYTTVTTTIATPTQTIKTGGDKPVSVTTAAIIKYRIEDARLYTSEIYDADDAITDIAQGHIMSKINGLGIEECNDINSLSNEITKKLRAEVKKYGIYIEQLTLTDFIETRNFRLFND
jgi:regulator of protease activity HflC (stomatin/prohibitin superfamily)